MRLFLWWTLGYNGFERFLRWLYRNHLHKLQCHKSEMTAILPFALVRRWLAFSDRFVRWGAMISDVSDLDEASMALFLRHAVDNRSQDALRTLYLDMVVVVLEMNALPEQKRQNLIERLNNDPYWPVFAFLSDLQGGRPPALTRETPYDYEDVPLGVRKAKARLHDPRVLKALAEDPDPSVVAILLQNAHATEEHALRVASLRPQNAQNFHVVLMSRFGVRERVQAAMVMNPFCPIRLAMALTPLLSQSHLQEVCFSPLLDVRVRDAAKVLLR